MNRNLILAVVLLFLAGGCVRKHPSTSAAKPTSFGTAIVESSGGKQVAPAGTILPQAVVVQVNDEQGNAVTGATVEFYGPAGVVFDPSSGITDSSGQFTTNVSLGSGGGRYEIIASTYDKSQKRIDVKLQEIALDYQQVLGQKLNQHYCERCHNQESTPERVSNYDNLAVKPHAFTDGEFYNKLSDDDVTALIGHGGPALNKSAQMPPYGYTLSNAEMQALLSFIRAVADPPNTRGGVTYAAR